LLKPLRHLNESLPLSMDNLTLSLYFRSVTFSPLCFLQTGVQHGDGAAGIEKANFQQLKAMIQCRARRKRQRI
jgi:hypothetical protein